MAHFTIKGRRYEATENEQRTLIRVYGEIFSKSGRLLPGLADSIHGELVKAGYPVEDHYSQIDNMPDGPRMGVLAFYFDTPGWYRAIYAVFADNFSKSQRACELHTRAGTLSRRYFMANLIGIDLNRRIWLLDPINKIKEKYNSAALKSWAEFKSEYNHLAPENIKFYFSYAEYDPPAIKIEPGDLAWLQSMLDEIQARLSGLNDGDTLTISAKLDPPLET